MKDATLQALITARALLEEAERHCASGDRYLATAGIIVLQDSVELIFLAMLGELGVDEQKALESLTFDQMIGDLRSLGVPVPKSGTLKAMNKLRVTAKHYGQIMEPVTVQGHLNAALQAIDAVLTAVIGKPLREVYLTELIKQGEPRSLLDNALAALNRGEYMDSLSFTRMAVFVEIENDYCVYTFREREHGAHMGIIAIAMGGWKAPSWTQYKSWIDRNVLTPFDYVQIDYERLRLDAMEWGINTQAVHNLRRMTPDVVRLDSADKWRVKYDASYPVNNATRENAIYCLDLAIDIVRRKQLHQGAVRTPARDRPFDWPPAYVGQPLLGRPIIGDAIIRHLEPADRYIVTEVLQGFDPAVTFYRISCTTSDGATVAGFVQKLQQALQANTGKV